MEKLGLANLAKWVMVAGDTDWHTGCSMEVGCCLTFELMPVARMRKHCS